MPDELCELGRYGQKNGKGYYQYKEGDRTPLPDPIADEVIARIREELGYVGRSFSDKEVLKRCIYPLVNIGAKLLEEGHALRAVSSGARRPGGERRCICELRCEVL